MHRQTLIRNIRGLLAKVGFYVSGEDTVNMVFDIIGRRDNLLLIIKVLINVDAFTKKNAEMLKMLGTNLEGAPLVVGRHAGNAKLGDSIVYSRYGIPVVTKHTLEEFLLEGYPPVLFSAPGGLYVKIDSEVLDKARDERKISLGTLAEIAGVSRKAIQMYCKNNMAPSIEVVLRLEDFLQIPLIMPINFLSFTKDAIENVPKLENLDSFERAIYTHLQKLGYSILPVVKCSFDALTKDKKNTFLTSVGKQKKSILKKARAIASISQIVEKYPVIFTDGEIEKINIEGTPLIAKKELDKIDDPTIVVELIMERRKNP